MGRRIWRTVETQARNSGKLGYVISAAPRFCLGQAAVVGVIGCTASTSIVNEWRNPDYSSPRFKKILVLAVSKKPRHTFEDEFAVKLKAAGVDAAPSYRYIPEEGPDC